MTTAAALAVVLVILAAAIEALSNVLQHKAANSPSHAGRNEAQAVLATLVKPLFLFAFLLMVIGYGFHVASLGLGNISVIQVIFVSQLVFVLPLSMWISKARVTSTDWFWAIVVTVGIALFVTFAQPTEGEASTSTERWLSSVVATAAVCAVVIVWGYRAHGKTRAALLGVAGGVMNGAVAPLTKGSIEIASNGGVGALFGSWLFYVTVVSTLLGVLFPLMAFRAGPITASFPAVMSLNPIVATLLGVYLFDEVLQGGIVNIVLMIVASLAILAGIVALSRSAAIATAFAETSADATEGAKSTES